jgi:acetyl esterase/lipase
VISDLAFGSDELQALDVYPVEGGGHPVVIFVHGGGWVGGDKAMLQKAESFASFFREQDVVLVAPNYRLMFDVTYREQAADVAGAVAWVAENIHEYGGDPERILLWGFSAGAHLVALVGTDPGYLGAHGLDPGDLAGVSSYDVIAYDIPRAIETAADLGYPKTAENLPRFFGDDPEAQQDASPVHHLGEAAELPPFLVVSARLQPGGGGQDVAQDLSPDQSRHFVEQLQAQGASASWEAYEGTHSGLVVPLGTADHEPTEWLQEFMEATILDRRP